MYCKTECNSKHRKQFNYADDKYISESVKNGFVPSEAFVFLDKNKCIQNENFIPILFHNYRNANKKHIRYNYHLNIKWRYNTCISNKEFSNEIVKKKKSMLVVIVNIFKLQSNKHLKLWTLVYCSF